MFRCELHSPAILHTVCNIWFMVLLQVVFVEARVIIYGAVNPMFLHGVVFVIPDQRHGLI